LNRHDAKVAKDTLDHFLDLGTQNRLPGDMRIFVPFAEWTVKSWRSWRLGG
jgi:hypothetical protein